MINEFYECCCGFSTTDKFGNKYELHHRCCKNYRKEKEYFIDEEAMKEIVNTHIFVFGDNDMRIGNGGAAKLRHLPNVYGFITKKSPSHEDYAYYKPNDEYRNVFIDEMKKLQNCIKNNSDKTFLISKLGAGLANKYHIYENVIEEHLNSLNQFNNVIFLF